MIAILSLLLNSADIKGIIILTDEKQLCGTFVIKPSSISMFLTYSNYSGTIG